MNVDRLSLKDKFMLHKPVKCKKKTTLSTDLNFVLGPAPIACDDHLSDDFSAHVRGPC